MEGIWYATVEDVKDALDYKETARNDKKIKDALEAGARYIERLTHRKFYPVVDTRYFPWPDRNQGSYYKLKLEEDEVISVTQLLSGTTEITSSDYFLEPVNEGPPYDEIQIDLDSAASFGQHTTHQRDITLTGTFAGCPDNSVSVGSLENAISDDTTTTVDVTDTSDIGIGSILKIENERMIVTAKSWLTTSQTLGGNMTATKDSVSVSVTNGAAFHEDEVILIDSEKMLITDIAGNTLTVKRAWDGSVLAAHTAAATIYTPRRLTVQRGKLGTTAASHADGTAITRYTPPGLIKKLNIAEALVVGMQELSGYARIAGLRNYNLRNATQRDSIGRSLDTLRDDVYTVHGRKVRKYAV